MRYCLRLSVKNSGLSGWKLEAWGWKLLLAIQLLSVLLFNFLKMKPEKE